MGREIRRVPPSGEHPRNERGHYQPLYDRGYKESVKQWLDDLQEFLKENPSGVNDKGYAFWDWDGQPPNEEYCRPDWTEEEATAYQIYENVSEGTPVSPVFVSEVDLRAWLIREWELSPEAADHFIKTGYSFSMIIMNGTITRPGTETIEAMAKLAKED